MTDPQRISAFSPITEAAATDSLVIVDVPDVPGGTKRIDASKLNINLDITAAENAVPVTPTNLLRNSGDIRRFGTVGDGVADDATAIQDADDAAAAEGSGIVTFPPGDFLLNSQINKDPFTTWKGSIGVQTPQQGTNLILGHNGTLIDIDSGGSELFAGNAGIRDMRLLGNMTNFPLGIGINFTAVSGSVRRQFFENLYIFGLDKGAAGIMTEQYWVRCFFSGGTFGIFATVMVDFWINNCHFGSGIGATGVTGGNGFRATNVRMLRMAACRGQVQEEGSGVFIENGVDIQISDHIGDSNQTFAIDLHNCQGVGINHGQFFDNGKTSAKQSAIHIQGTGRTFTANASTDELTITAHGYQNTDVKVQVSTTGTLPAGLSANTDFFPIRVDANTLQLATTIANAVAGTQIDITDTGSGTHTLVGIVENIKITGGECYDKSTGGADEVQDKGIEFAGLLDNIIRDIEIDNVSLNRVTTPLAGQNAVDLRFKVTNCPGVVTVKDNAGDQNITFAVNSTGNAENTVIYDTPLTAKRTVFLTSPGANIEDEFNLIRSPNCTGAFDLALSFGAVDIALLAAASDNTTAIRTATAWVIKDF